MWQYISVIILARKSHTKSKEYVSMNNNNLSKILYQNKMTYRKLSRLSGISKTSLNDIANFREDPKQSTMIAIARGLNMEVVDIFDLEWRESNGEQI